MSVANSRMTIASILGAVQTSANTISSTLTAANSAVGMVNTFVTKAAENQQIRADFDQATFLEGLLEEKSMEMTAHRLKIDEFTKQSPRHEELYKAAYESLNGIASKHRQQPAKD